MKHLLTYMVVGALALVLVTSLRTSEPPMPTHAIPVTGAVFDGSMLSPPLYQQEVTPIP